MREKTESSVACNHHKVGFLGLLVTLGIVFGDIGTSPLYVMKAILHTGETINESTILGALSCIIWTLTLQTTIKYVCVALRADLLTVQCDLHPSAAFRGHTQCGIVLNTCSFFTHIMLAIHLPMQLLLRSRNSPRMLLYRLK